MYKKQTLERLLTEQTSSSSSQAAEPVNPFFVPTAQSTTAVDTLESENVAPALEFDDSFGDAHGEPPVAAPNVEPLPPIEPSDAAGQFSQESAQSLESLGKSAAETEPDWGDPERALEELWKSTGGLDPISPDSGSYEVGLSESADLYNLTGPAAHLDIPLDRFERPAIELPAASADELDLPPIDSGSSSYGGHAVESQSAEDALAALRNIASKPRDNQVRDERDSGSSDQLGLESGAEGDEEAIDSLLGRLAENGAPLPPLELEEEVAAAPPEPFAPTDSEVELVAETTTEPPVAQIEPTISEDFVVPEPEPELESEPDPLAVQSQTDNDETLDNFEQMLAETGLEFGSDTDEADLYYSAIAPEEPIIEPEVAEPTDPAIFDVEAASLPEKPALESSIEDVSEVADELDEPIAVEVSETPEIPDLTDALGTLTEAIVASDDAEPAETANVLAFPGPESSTTEAVQEEEVQVLSDKTERKPEKSARSKKRTSRADKKDRPNVPTTSGLVDMRGSKSLRYKPEFKMLAVHPGIRSIESEEAIVELTSGETKRRVSAVAYLKPSTVGLWRQSFSASEELIAALTARQPSEFELDLPLAEWSHTKPVPSLPSRPKASAEELEFDSSLGEVLNRAASNTLYRLTPRASQPQWCADKTDVLWGGEEWRTNFGSAKELDRRVGQK